MNVIRTKVVELDCASVLAYRYKNRNGGAGISLVDVETGASASGSIDKRTGKIPAVRDQGGGFSAAAWEEAAEKTLGLPYSSRGKVVGAVRKQGTDTKAAAAPPPDEELEAEQKAPDMTERAEYLAIIARFTNKKTGKFDCGLLSKDFIQFAAGSKTVADMVAAREDVDAIIRHIARSRFETIAGTGRKNALTDAEVRGLTEALDAIYVKSIFKGLKSHIKRMLAG